jgi:hypothetical protein
VSRSGGPRGRRRQRGGPGAGASAGSAGSDRAGRGRRDAVVERPWLQAAALAGLHVILALAVFDPTPHTGGDNAAYLSLGRSLLQRHAYLELWDPLTPPHTQYPPVFPAVLGLLQALGLDSWVAFKLLIVAFSALAVALTYRWLRAWHSAGLALAVTLVVAVSPGVLDLAHWVLSDVPFWALATGALWAWALADGSAGEAGGVPAAGSTREEGGGATSRFKVVAVAALVTLLAYFTRSAGLPLVVAAGLRLALRRRWRDLAVTVGIIGVPAALWWLRGRTAGVDYVQQFLLVDPYDPSQGRIGVAALVSRVGANAAHYFQRHLPILLFGRDAPVLVALGAVVLALAAAGWVLRVRRVGLRRPGTAELFLPLYLGLLLVWPAVWSGERFLLPALPLLLACAGVAVLALQRWLSVRAVRWLAAGGVAILIGAGLGGLSRSVDNGFACSRRYLDGDALPCLPPAYADFFHLAEWARDSLPPDAAVISRKPTLFYWFSGRRSRIYPKQREAAAFFRMADTIHSRYLLVDALDALTSFYVVPIIEAYPRGFCMLRATSDGAAVLLGLTPEAAHLPDDVAPEPQGTELALDRCPATYLAPSSGGRGPPGGSARGGTGQPGSDSAGTRRGPLNVVKPGGRG